MPMADSFGVGRFVVRFVSNWLNAKNELKSAGEDVALDAKLFSGHRMRRRPQHGRCPLDTWTDKLFNGHRMRRRPQHGRCPLDTWTDKLFNGCRMRSRPSSRSHRIAPWHAPATAKKKICPQLSETADDHMAAMSSIS
eukprot:gnl/TRDRNA2_/TRDRNA2_149135_c2_seq1.p1 gnl/TRDRNA2_/TRDRNA2_149135_c2~~gnl/TRDRNA2_/TRDRNA2_149135_c2_seq1.p1  ORF type:complete len:138 (-),score=7.98 gnl/TRDRNA2_/TRDRNA2_149135_c2_seq1:276-689(-)